MRRIAVVVALNLVAAAAYGFVAAQMGFFSHMGETLFSSPDSLGYRDVGNWLFGAIPNPVESLHRPFLYPLLLGAASRIGGDAAIWTLNLLLWLGTVNVTAAATWRMTGRPLFGAIVFLLLATNVSLIVLSFQALTELTVAFLEAIWILGLALSTLPPSRPRDIAMLLLPISLLTVVKPAYQIELLVGLVLLAIVIWRLQRGRAAAAVVVAACCIPIAFQLGLNATANHVFNLSSTGDAEVRGYYVSQVYASINGLPDDLVAARTVVYGWSNSQLVSFLMDHPGPAVGTLVSNLHSNLASGSNFIDSGKTPLLAAAVRDTNRAFLRVHLIFLPVVAVAIWLRRDVRLVLLYAFAVVVILVPSLIFDQGDRYIEMALPLWAAAYALAVSDLLSLIRSITRRSPTVATSS
ncbi:MAG TPA: hypothetical protein VF956_02680 [Candidatus Dormibacteraeota bacterium]